MLRYILEVEESEVDVQFQTPEEFRNGGFAPKTVLHDEDQEGCGYNDSDEYDPFSLSSDYDEIGNDFPDEIPSIDDDLEETGSSSFGTDGEGTPKGWGEKDAPGMDDIGDIADTAGGSKNKGSWGQNFLKEDDFEYGFDNYNSIFEQDEFGGI